MLEYRIVPASNFTELSPITQSSGVCFDGQGRILLMRQHGKRWNIPGGTTEANETPEETMRREVYEETTIVLGECAPIAYQEVVDDGVIIKYQTRFACLIKTIEPQRLDPDTNTMHELAFIEPSLVMNYIEYKQFKLLFELAVHWYTEQLSSSAK